MKSIYNIAASKIKNSFILTELVKVILFMGILMLLFVASKSFGQTPGYILNITNDQQTSGSAYEFDIYLLRTGSNSFEYANNSQYFININPAIINGGALTFTIITGTCELNIVQQILSSRVSFDAANNRLRIASHSPSGAGTGTIIANTGLGTKLGRFKVTNTVTFAASQTNMKWYNFHSGFYTKVFAYVGGLNAELTDSTTHQINIVNNPLPVVLTEFNASVSNNNVVLNWRTASEMNNSGFEIQRTVKDKIEWKKIWFIQGNGTTSEVKAYNVEDKRLRTSIYKYRLKQIDFNGNFEYFDLSTDVVIGKPGQFSFSQNYPNPSNPKSKIDYQIPFDGKVSIKVYDLLGREVATLVNEFKTADFYTVEFDGNNLASGVYLYRIEARDASSSLSMTKTMKMVLVK